MHLQQIDLQILSEPTRDHVLGTPCAAIVVHLESAKTKRAELEITRDNIHTTLHLKDTFVTRYFCAFCENKFSFLINSSVDVFRSNFIFAHCKHFHYDYLNMLHILYQLFIIAKYLYIYGKAAPCRMARLNG